MNRLVATVFLNIFLLAFTNGQPFAKSSIKKLADDHYQILFSDEPKDSIKILQLTDLHLGNQYAHRKNFQTTQRIKKFVELFNPDVIAITGDLYTGKKVDREYLVVFATQFADDLDRPWFFTFGNHDPEGGIGKDSIRTIMQCSEWGILGTHTDLKGQKKDDYLIELLANDSKSPAWELFAFDSGSEKDTKSVKADQLAWFREKVLASNVKHGATIPAVAFFHIPVRQYADLAKNPSAFKGGAFHEEVCFEEDDGSVYEAFVRQGNVRAIAVGHDHDNNYWGTFSGGILLIYGHVSGDSGYHRHWAPGVKLLSLPVNGGEIGVQDLVLPDERAF